MGEDFSGYATRSGIRCSDGRTILPDAFKHQDGTKVPLMWSHQHDNPDNILGHAVLENRADGVYAYAFFNESEAAKVAKEAVRHGDINAMSIFANQLVQKTKNVIHGAIREVSLVMAGANPGALIENVNLTHGDDLDLPDEEVIIHSGLTIVHAENDSESNEDEEDTKPKQGESTVAAEDKTVKYVFDSMSEEQKNVVYFMIGEAMSEGEEDSVAQSDISESLAHIQEGLDLVMSRNTFDNSGDEAQGATLSHAQIQAIVKDGIKAGSLKESFLAHAGEYGITDIELLFPDARNLDSKPELLARQAEWVPKVLGATKHVPFAKTKSIVADLTAAEARAKGYVKGTEKKDEVISLLRRTTSPATIYKKQKLDRDDILDITDFDVVAWLKWEIRFMLNEELARAILVGDGRSVASEDKIKDPIGSNDGTGIRSIANDADMYAHKVQIAANTLPADTVDEIARSRTHYRGSGNPTFYTTDKNVTDLLLIKDKMGRRLYETEAALASALRVKEIVAVEVLEEHADIVGIMVNLVDYTIGTNKGGELSFFEDFDIDFNQNKYLLETRLSGALTKPKSAIVIRRNQGSEAVATAPSFDGPTNTITVPTVTGVDYLINDTVVTGDQVISEDTTITAAAQDGYYLESNSTTSWSYAYTAA